MRFGRFDKVPLTEFLADKGADVFWFFVHIPKTAGSSLSTELRRVMKPYRNLGVDYARLKASFNADLKDTVDAFLHESDFARHRSASGHVPMDLARQFRETNPRVRYFTFLRNPVARVISDYRYQRTPMHPPHEQFMKDFPTLESYIEHPASQNKMAYFVTGTHDPSRASLLRCADEEFDFIGLLEMYPMSFNILFELMGAPGSFPVEHVRKTPDTPETSVKITPAVEAAIREANGLDLALYAHVRSRLVARREEWRALSPRRSPAAPQREATRSQPAGPLSAAPQPDDPQPADPPSAQSRSAEGAPGSPPLPQRSA